MQALSVIAVYASPESKANNLRCCFYRRFEKGNRVLLPGGIEKKHGTLVRYGRAA